MKLNLIFFLLISFFVRPVCAEGMLYEGEHLIEINKAQTLYKFSKGDVSKPLLILLPGDANLARIFYGFPNGKEDDFLTYWLSKKGYSWLAISYPNDNPVFHRLSPYYNLRDWGAQVAMLTKKIISENSLSDHVVVLAWHMAGHVEEPVQEFLQKEHVDLDEFIGLSASSPIFFSKMQPLEKLSMSSNHLAERKDIIRSFKAQLLLQNNYNGHEIIPQEVYSCCFVGNTPVALLGTGYFLNQNKFEYNEQKALEDSSVFNFEHTPWIALLNDDSPSFLKINLIEPADWAFIRNEMLYYQIVYYMNIESSLPKLAIIRRIFSQIPRHFSDTVHGNSLFFVGKSGARDTALKVDMLIQHVNGTKQNLMRLALD